MCNQHYCPVCNIVVERADLVRGFQHAKDKYVPITEEELESFETEANRSVDLKEFIPLASAPIRSTSRTLTISVPIKAGSNLTAYS
jgi:non-homologous end joining protein Ku